MNVLVDTSVWSIVLRRKEEQDTLFRKEIEELIAEGRVRIFGLIRQELLSGIKMDAQFQHLRKYLSAFPDLEMITRDYETAAKYYNICRSKGIQGSTIDFLICAVAHRYQLAVFTTDRDFEQFSEHIPLMLYQTA